MSTDAKGRLPLRVRVAVLPAQAARPTNDTETGPLVGRGDCFRRERRAFAMRDVGVILRGVAVYAMECWQ
jgi:hypothetical protein